MEKKISTQGGKIKMVKQPELPVQPPVQEQPKKDDFPEVLKEEKAVKTKVRNMSTIIEEKLAQLKDLATMEVLMDVHVRMKHRLESIKKKSSAHSIKVRGIWKTIAPMMHIKGLEGKKINNDEVEISFEIYQVDDKGNKKLHTHYAEVEMRDGSKINRATSAEYRIAYVVTERIKTGKPITREVVRIDRIQEE